MNIYQTKYISLFLIAKAFLFSSESVYSPENLIS